MKEDRDLCIEEYYGHKDGNGKKGGTNLWKIR